VTTGEARIQKLLGELDLEEKVAMLSGHGFFDQFVEDGRYCASLYHIGAGNERLGIPPLLFMDGPRGIGMGASTCFPVPMARGASFDVDLEQRIGDAIGRELRSHGGNLFGGVCINLLRHPAWGRAQETYGEDPFLLGEMGAALVRGVQHHNVVATPKHFACNSMENARFTVDVRIDERALREVYLPHFERCIRAGAGAVMSAYNRVNGAYCGHNHRLLTGILKEDWGFDGFVYSDFVMGCRGADACAAGLDVEAPDTVHFGDKLVAAVEAGELSRDRIDDAVGRVLRSLFRVLDRDDPEEYGAGNVACNSHIALAREAAEKSIVLLKNAGNTLPWQASTLRKLLVLGSLADVENLGDHGSSRVYPPEVITPLSGLREAAGSTFEILHDEGEDRGRVQTLAREADAVLILAGYTHRDEGEYIPGEMVDLSGDGSKHIGGDRLDLSLGAEQEALIIAAAGANPNTVVAVMAGSAVTMEAWRDRVAAILMLWYPGMQGGAALANVLLGAVNPSGRLPFTVPREPAHLPFFDRDADTIEYDLWHGYTKFERDGITPAFPFGFGLSYTQFAFMNVTVDLPAGGQSAQVSVDVTNTGAHGGEAVVQVYAGRAQPLDGHPLKRLCGFCRVALEPGACDRVTIEIALRDLAWFNVEDNGWCLESAEWRFAVGASSDEAELVHATLVLPSLTWRV
jgi:beta-glucosidase